ncbi:hypothetical protein BGZ72_001390 [Mortierella alpina]|nr:hypothetical protein BGZ72_001390 [Mortierella alpina]
MSNAFCKRDAAPITRNEYCVLINVHRHLSNSGPLHSTLQNATPLKRLATATGVETVVAREAIRLCKKQESPPDYRHNVQTAHEIVIAIRKVFLEAHQTVTSLVLVTADLLLRELASKHNIYLHERTLFRYLRRLNYHSGQDPLLHVIFESQKVVDYRNLYVERRVSNLDNNGLPIKPEVFVDESFWTLDGNSRPLRVSQGIGLNARGPMPLVVVFGAFVVHSVQNRVVSKFVRKSLLIWPMRGIGQDLPGSIRTDEELWRSVPKAVQKAGIATDFQDWHYYYSYLDDNIWEGMFESLCKTLYQDYGDCQIHIDGAGPHMRRENMLPYAPESLQDARNWFIENKLPVPTGNKGVPLSKAELIIRAREAKVPPQLACDTIASKHGHTLLRIPRRHYEFQPMERVWKAGNQSTIVIPRATVEPELKLRNRLLEIFAGLTETHLTQYWEDTVASNLGNQIVYQRQSIGQVTQGDTDSEWSDEGV